jgi:hypothetical protein
MPPGAYGMPIRRGPGFRGVLLVLGIVLGLYFLNLAFLWVKVPSVPVLTIKHLNIFAGVLFILLGFMAVTRRKY